jgi:hypothetical protein
VPETLHDTYRSLRDRGMPEHPMLTHREVADTPAGEQFQITCTGCGASTGYKDTASKASQSWRKKTIPYTRDPEFVQALLKAAKAAKKEAA